MAVNILVISDTHGHPEKISEVLSRQIRRPDYLLFLGDGLKDLLYCDGLDGVSVYSVSGNCDFNYSLTGFKSETEHIIDIDGIKIFMAHGHKYNVKYGETSIIYAARERDADIVVFGHTHLPHEERIEYTDSDNKDKKKELYIFNPGSLGYGDTWGNICIDREGRILLSHGRL